MASTLPHHCTEISCLRITDNPHTAICSVSFSVLLSTPWVCDGVGHFLLETLSPLGYHCTIVFWFSKCAGFLSQFSSQLAPIPPLKYSHSSGLTCGSSFFFPFYSFSLSDPINSLFLKIIMTQDSKVCISNLDYFFFSEHRMQLCLPDSSVCLTDTSNHKIVIVRSLGCVRLCDPMDRSMSGSSVLHYFLEFAQIHVHWVKMKVKSLGRVRLFATPWTVTYQAPWVGDAI